MKDYNHSNIEKKWQKEWTKKKVYKTEDTSKKKKYYVLDMFPYPSGTGLHVGHPKGYIGSDVFARMKRMQGFNVLHPMGFDSFGLPAEQYAIQTNNHPGKFTDKLVKDYINQLQILGMSYDWSRMVETHKPDFYHWTQWIFLKIYNSYYNTEKNKAEPIEILIKKFEKIDKTWKTKTEKEKQDILMKHRLAYEGYSEVNWCPELGTVLANDEIIDGPHGPVSERGGYKVEKKNMRQWFMRITSYADRLLSGLDTLNWSDHIKEIQRNWIGKSEGLIFSARVKDTDITIETFSAHFEACYADTFFVIAPDHPLLPKLVEGLANKNEILKKAQEIVERRNSFDEGEYKEIDGIFTGRYAIDPLGNGDLPIWVGSFALANYGTGIVKCSAHDERDFAFAKKFNIPLKVVLIPALEKLQKEVLERKVCFTDLAHGILTEPKEFAGYPAQNIRKDMIQHVVSRGFARVHTTYKMRDAVFARQRYWGEPIPLYTDNNGIIHEVSENKLPLKLPNVVSYKPTGTGESPLALVSMWTKKGFETNTMPGWAGSSWYFLRYMDPKNKKAFADKKKIQYWKDVDMYVGGQEHATGHLLYSRFWHKVLKDYGIVPTEEPFKTLRNQGLILGTDGRKMSKRWGNVINPNDIVATYGADTLRVYEMFMGPFDGALPWSTENIIGSRRFIERVWRVSDKVSTKMKSPASFEMLLHKTIKKVGDDIEVFGFNTAISAMMILLNEMEKQEKINQKDFEIFLKILSPFAPHMTAELWSMLEHKTLLVTEKWPVVDNKKMMEINAKIIIQINSKVRATHIVPMNLSEADVVAEVKKLPAVDKWLLGKEIKNVFYIKNKLVNFVVL